MGKDSFIFDIKVQSTPPYEGALLVAEPFLRENYFNHAVICLVDYTPGHTAMGLVLNKVTHYSLSDLLDNVTDDRDIPVFCGGPMSCDHLYCIHTLGDIVPQARHVTGDLYVGGDFTQAIEYIKSGYPVDGCIRFFVGYTMWSVGMLENEILDNKWASVPESTPPDLLLTGAGDRFWHRTVRSLGPQYRSWNLLPRNITCN